MGLALHFLRRFAGLLLLFWAVSALAFALLALTPGDPAQMILAASGVDVPTPEAVAAKREELGLNQPTVTRYLLWLQGAVRGEFGMSYRTAKPVVAMYAERLPGTLALATMALALTLLVAPVLGVLAAMRRGWLDTLLQVVVLLGGATPGFWLALVLILVFSATLRWLPALGAPTLPGMLLPSVVLALPHIATLSRLIRAAMLDALSTDYVRAARAKGLSGPQVAARHALPNVLSGVMTVLALEVAYLLTGTVIIESVFAYPGVGRLAVDAALIGDMPVLVLCVIVSAGVYALCNALADAAMFALDPRLRAAPSTGAVS